MSRNLNDIVCSCIRLQIKSMPEYQTIKIISNLLFRFTIISRESRSSPCLSINRSRSAIYFSDSLSSHANPDHVYVWASINQDKQSMVVFRFAFISCESRSSPCLTTNRSRSAIYFSDLNANPDHVHAWASINQVQHSTFQICYHFMRIQIKSTLEHQSIKISNSLFRFAIISCKSTSSPCLSINQ